MKLLLLFALILRFGVFCQGRHIEVHSGGIKGIDNIGYEAEPTSEMLNSALSYQPRYVPVNSVLYFKSSEPCPEGFRRDILGVCREVWD